VAKIITVSRMDLTVAQVLATQSNPSTVVFGALLLFFPLIPIAGMNVSLLLLSREWARSTRGTFKANRGVRVLFAAAAFGAFLSLGAYATPRAVFLGSLVITLGAPLFAAIVAAVRAAWKHRRKYARSLSRLPREQQAWRHKIGLAFAVIYVVGTVLQSLPIVVSDVAWLPPRQIRLVESPGFVGYEISRTDEAVSLLREVDRKVVEVRASEIVSADPCRLDE
jgi:hypothetical protein